MPGIDEGSDLASKVVSTLRLGMRVVSSEMQSQKDKILNFQQLVVLRRLRSDPNQHLSLLADRMGATISATSKLVDGLVDRRLVNRETDEGDRRRITLSLTDEGRAALESQELVGVTHMAGLLGELSPSEQGMVGLAMDILSAAFTRGR